MTMLYERWRRIAHEHRNEFALRDLGSDGCWTFGELAAEAERGAPESGPAAFAQGSGAGFILTVIRAWRTGQILCPLEPGQPAPDVAWPGPPVVHLKTSSATTGRPRWIAFTSDQLAADADNLVATMGLRPDWPNLGLISMAHSYGFSNLVTPLLLHGIPLILGASVLPEAVRIAARSETALTLAAVPALWRAWHEANAIPSNVRLAISAGAPLQASLEQAVFESVGIKIHNFYGASECGGIAYDRTNTPRRDPTLAGTPVENVSVTVAENGCLEVRGPTVGECYWPEAGLTLGHGAFLTSDLAALRNGQVFLVGRLSDVINVAGRKVAPETIECVLLEHPSVREAVVLGVPRHDEREDAIAAVVACAQPVTESELRQFLLSRLPPWQVPRLWRVGTESLANARGKVARARWRSAFLAGRQPDAGSGLG